jgi:hypothetical protein
MKQDEPFCVLNYDAYRTNLHFLENAILAHFARELQRQ